MNASRHIILCITALSILTVPLYAMNEKTAGNAYFAGTLTMYGIPGTRTHVCTSGHSSETNPVDTCPDQDGSSMSISSAVAIPPRGSSTTSIPATDASGSFTNSVILTGKATSPGSRMSSRSVSPRQSPSQNRSHVLSQESFRSELQQAIYDRALAAYLAAAKKNMREALPSLYQRVKETYPNNSSQVPSELAASSSSAFRPVLPKEKTVETKEHTNAPLVIPHGTQGKRLAPVTEGTGLPFK